LPSRIGGITLGGVQRERPTFGFEPRAASAAQIQGASDLELELLKRLAPGGGFTLSDYSKDMNAGIGERLAGLFGAGLSVAGAGMDAYQRSRKPTVPPFNTDLYE
jgi:hypothetical protein